jgi:hypothetical protein
VRESTLKDNWIYIQEPDSLVGRTLIFKKWNQYMVADPRILPSARKIGILIASDVSDAHVVRVPKRPACF